MPPNFRKVIIAKIQNDEFDVAGGDFSHLEIRSVDERFYYFYDSASRRLIKHFRLGEKKYVDTMCDVILIKKSEVFTPRLTLWKKDKTKSNTETMTEEELITKGITALIKARVNVDDCYESFWKLIDFLRTYQGIELPEYEFCVSEREVASLAEVFEGRAKDEVLAAVRTYLSGQLSEQDVQMLLDRRKTLDRFCRLLNDEVFLSAEETRLNLKGELLWQGFFEDNPWIFGYGLTFVSCEKYNDAKLEQITTGSNVFYGGGKRVDALMRTRGFIRTLLFAEIKRNDTRLLMSTQYREPDVYQVSKELGGAVSQVQKTAHKAIKHLEDLHRSYDPRGRFQFEISTIRPRQIVVLGSLDQLSYEGAVNLEMLTTFELYRRGQQDVEILTFDELYERTRFIVESQEFRQ